MDCHDGSQPAEADPVRVEQIVCSLPNNAAKFTPRPNVVRRQLSVDGPDARIMLEDRSIGVDPRRIDDLFDQFPQVDRSLDRTASGLGMGLTITRRPVELQTGTSTRRATDMASEYPRPSRGA